MRARTQTCSRLSRASSSCQAPPSPRPSSPRPRLCVPLAPWCRDQQRAGPPAWAVQGQESLSCPCQRLIFCKPEDRSSGCRPQPRAIGAPLLPRRPDFPLCPCPSPSTVWFPSPASAEGIWLGGTVPPGPQTTEAPGGCLASGLWVRARGDTRPETRRQPGRRQFSGCFPSGQLGNTPSPPGWGPEPGTEEALGERGTTWHMWAPGAEGEAGAPLLHEDRARWALQRQPRGPPSCFGGGPGNLASRQLAPTEPGAEVVEKTG